MKQFSSLSTFDRRGWDESLRATSRSAQALSVLGSPISSHNVWPQISNAHSPSELAPKTIYVVDSEPSIASSVAHLLEFAGFNVTTFSDRGLAWFAMTSMSPKPALLITDHLGGWMTGLELITRCKAEAPALKTLLCSGLPRKALPDSPVPPDEFLEKPFSAELLISRVCRLVGDRRRSVTHGNQEDSSG